MKNHDSVRVFGAVLYNNVHSLQVFPSQVLFHSWTEIIGR